MTKETIDVQGCADCLMFCANGELPPENTEEEDKKLIGAFHHIYDQGYHVCCGSDKDQDDSFSTLPCEICNSPRGGNRYTMHLMEEA